MLQEYKYKKMLSELGKDPSNQDVNSPKTDINRGRQNNVMRLNQAYNNSHMNKKSVKFEVRHVNKQ